MLQQQAVPITGSQVASAPSVVQVKDFIEGALPANSGMNDDALSALASGFVTDAASSEMGFSALASQTSMSLDAFIAAANTSQVCFLAYTVSLTTCAELPFCLTCFLGHPCLQCFYIESLLLMVLSSDYPRSGKFEMDLAARSSSVSVPKGAWQFHAIPERLLALPQQKLTCHNTSSSFCLRLSIRLWQFVGKSATSFLTERLQLHQTLYYGELVLAHCDCSL